MTRGMLAAALYRLDGLPDVPSGGTHFSDLTSDKYYYNAVRWAQSQDIIKGITPSYFGGEMDITREQAAVMLYRYAEAKGYDITGRSANISTYTDYNETSDYAREALSWANHNSIITGITPTRLAPKESATRAQAAKMIHAFATAFVE